ncbi:hypothetical protein U6G28_09030 [Actinomycetaceae bacterium MB13-C1-2]|nr:hypothetical protein U6G28_09030 [Actinomycetaceae bacterium MB13-C1-2]
MSTSHKETEWWTYVQTLIGNDNYVEAASKAGFDKSAFTRWKQGAKADPAFAVKLARAYNANVIHALVVSGLLTNAEAQLKEVTLKDSKYLEKIPADELLAELRRRID